jgi:tartrate dehydrogenase/decarboxylase/D-malate dehydrogenase
MTRRHNVAAIPGDGIGKQLVHGVTKLVDAAVQQHGAHVEWVDLDWSCDRYREHGEFMPADWADVLDRTDAIFLGAVGDPAVPDHVSLWNLLLPIRRDLRQSINVRPIASLPGVPTPLAATNPFDILIVRENNEGEYTSVGGSVYADTRDEVVVQSSVFTRHGTERVARYAFEQARGRRGEVVSATKSNGLPHSMPFWDRVVAEVADEYPDVRCRQMHIDALAARLVLAPQEFDVIVGSNLFGDILSDLGAALMGGIGLAASANVNPTGERPSMFEPVHGSAPDIVGKGIANPVGQVLSAVLMLRHLHEPEAADALRNALAAALAEATGRTPDIGGRATTEDVFACISSHLLTSTEPAGSGAGCAVETATEPPD